jgi:protein gp37
MPTVQILGDCWDTISGCTRISAGCAHCYAERFTSWINRMGTSEKYAAGFARVVCHEDWLDMPLRRRKAKTYFVNSMSDTFHADVPDEFIHRIFDVMNRSPKHNFQILTKRPERMLAMDLDWSGNIWAGVSVERHDYAHRIGTLRQVPARLKWIMFEPLVGPVGEMNLEGIDWAIVGGESGHQFRPMETDWVRDIRDQCAAAGVKFVFKQYAGRAPAKLGRDLDGVLWDQRPEPLKPLSVPDGC